jgi:prepilin-type processing-associated H-X9-DG protein
LCGEKSVNPDHYEDGLAAGDRWNLYIGCDNDIVRYSAKETSAKGSQTGSFSTVAQDGSLPDGWAIWGSAHPSGFNMCFCDGSVRTIPYSITAEVHDHLGHRKDGAVVDGSAIGE